MKQLATLVLIFLSVPWVLINQIPTTNNVTIAQLQPCNSQNNKKYASHMQLGYRSSTQIKTRKIALNHFKLALKLCPSNAEAIQASKNIELQLQKGNVVHVTPSGIGAPSNRAQAATRKENCLDGKKLVALIPEEQLVLTSKERPTLIFNIPKTSAPMLRATLETNGAEVYTKTLKTPSKTGFVQFKFSEFADSPPLTTGKTYQWTFTLLCDPQDPSANVTVSGSIKRIELGPILASELKTAKPSDRVILYANNGLWYDTLSTLIESAQSTPADKAQLENDWNEILKSVGLDTELN